MPIAKFESMLKTNSVYFFDANEFEEIIDFYIETGKHNLANKALKLGLEQHPMSSVLLILKAELYIFEDRLEEAFKLLKRLESIEPFNDEVYIQQADIYSKKHQHLQAVEMLNKALDCTDNPADVWLLLGMEYIFLNNFSVARTYFELTIKESPDDFSALFNVVYCFDMEQKPYEAIAFLNKLIDEHPYSEVAWHQLGRQYYGIGEFEEALRAFDYASLIDDEFVGAFVEKAKTLEKLDRPSEAIENYLISLELDDATAFVCYRVARCYEKLEKFEYALQYYAKATVEDPLLEKGWYSLARLYYKLEDFEKAYYYCQTLLKLEQENFAYWNLYAVLSLKHKMYEEAIEGYKNCIRLDANHLEIWLAVVDCLIFIGEHDQATSYTEEAMKSHMNRVELSYRLGALYFLYGNKDLGLGILEHSKRIDPSYEAQIKCVFPELFVQKSLEASIG